MAHYCFHTLKTLKISRYHRKARSGFTLIELMIVIVIISVLIAILIPNLVRAKYNAHLSRCEFNLRAMASVIELYHTENHVYPTALNASFFMSQMGRSAPTCPSSGTTYGYTLSADGKEYTISCDNGIHYVVLQGVVAPGYPQFSPNGGIKLK